MWDANAKAIATKAIGQVESGMDYLAVNYNDPITLGIGQWYGTRAAALLGRIRTQNASSFVGVAATLVSDLDARPADDKFWNDRYLTKAEGESLKPVLNNNKAIQNTLMGEDLEGYKASAVKCFIDPDGNTEMMLLWFTAFHQTPNRARNLIANIGADSTIDRLLSAILNEPVFGRYPTRYKTAYNIIKTGDTGGVIVTPDPVVPPADPGGSPSNSAPTPGLKRPTGDIDNIRVTGDSIHVTMNNGSVVVAVQGPGGLYLPGLDPAAGVVVPPPTQEQPPTVPPVVQPPDDPSDANQATRLAIAKFVTDRINRYKYAQAPGRREPDKSGFTDCSGLVGYAYRTVAGIDPGNATFDQLTTGTRIAEGSGNIDESLLRVADLILYDWSGGRANVDHVEMYTGPNQVTGHGGPGIGPTQKSLQGMANRAKKWYVNRYV